jgi:uncharacterized protein (TIGR02246 family)
MTMSGIRASIVAAFALTACAGAGSATNDSASMQDDQVKVAAVRDAFAAAFNANDAAGVAALYASDGMSQPNMQPTAQGIDGILAGYKGLFDAYTVTGMTITSTKVEISGNLAYDIGTFRFTGVPKAAGDTLKADGRYVVILRKDASGTWKVVADLDNVATMPPAPPAPGARKSE